MREQVTLDHPIFARWPAQRPDWLQFFSAPTANGPSGTPLALFESGAIASILPTRRDNLSRTDPNTRYETIQMQREKAHEDPNHHRRHLRRPCLLDGRRRLRP
jgi:hypothetical protein